VLLKTEALVIKKDGCLIYEEQGGVEDQNQLQGIDQI
jgi:hypothetical protein